MKKRYIFAPVLLLLFSCSSNSSGHIIPLEQMRQILWQMSLADQVVEADTSRLVRLHVKDSVTRIYGQILGDHKVSEADYKKSLDYYMAKPEIMQQLVDTTAALGKKITDSFKVKYKPKPLIKPADSIKKTPPVTKKKDTLGLHVHPSLPLRPNGALGHGLLPAK